MTNTDLKPINTVFSVDSILDIKELVNAKVLMNEEYGNKFSFIPPHLGFAIVPFPEDKLQNGIQDLTEYVKNQKTFKVTISDLIYEEKEKFFYVDIQGEDLKRIHEETTRMLNRYRGNLLREKDFLKLQSGVYDPKSEKYLKEFGYSRVFDNYKTHVTIGNYTVENIDIEKLSLKLKAILKPILNKGIVIDNIHGVFHTDSANNQSEMKQLWDKVFKL